MFLIMHRTPGILLHCLKRMITAKTFPMKMRIIYKMMQNGIMKIGPHECE
ncbi:hypothetical protein V6Z12_D02G280500 [Gossypium hirsutum]